MMLQGLQAPYGQGLAFGEPLSGMDYAVRWLMRPAGSAGPA